MGENVLFFSFLFFFFNCIIVLINGCNSDNCFEFFLKMALFKKWIDKANMPFHNKSFYRQNHTMFLPDTKCKTGCADFCDLTRKKNPCIGHGVVFDFMFYKWLFTIAILCQRLTFWSIC